jgi:hypothetical protein
MKIIVEQASNGYKAYKEGDTKSWEAGSSVDGAVAAMHISYPELQNAPVHVKG